MPFFLLKGVFGRTISSDLTLVLRPCFVFLLMVPQEVFQEDFLFLPQLSMALDCQRVEFC